MFLMFAHTVKFKAPGMLFFRRLHRVSSAAIGHADGSTLEMWQVNCKTGAKAFIPTNAVVIFGKRVKLG